MITIVLDCGGRSLDLSRPAVMGILNVTPDSFSDGGIFLDPKKAVEHALQMVEEGADIIDIGGESSRPGAQSVSVDEELRRVLPVIRELRKQSKISISIDTTKSVVAAQAIEAGATMINDISAGRFDPEMFSVAAKANVPICLMHMKGTPQNMQKDPHYDDAVAEVKLFLKERIEAAKKAGVGQKQIIIDVGIGFGKRVEDNVALLKNLDQLQNLGCPILIGTSRKSFIGALTGAEVKDRLPGNLASLAIAIQKGASIARVHDVGATKQFLQVLTSL